jgi:hypothetical protein
MVNVKRGDWISLVNAKANRMDAINMPKRFDDGRYEWFSCMTKIVPVGAHERKRGYGRINLL